jgi:hypothetical protein
MGARVVNNFTRPVILADQRDPDVSWQHHLERGSAGGVDLAYEMGTPILANADGWVEWIDKSRGGSGGNTARLHLSGDGASPIAYIEYMHLDRGIAHGSVVKLDQKSIVGWSGRSGMGEQYHYDPHLHVHAVLHNGWRVNLFDYFTGHSTSGDAWTPFPNGEDETAPAHIPTEFGDIMARVVRKEDTNTVIWVDLEAHKLRPIPGGKARSHAKLCREKNDEPELITKDEYFSYKETFDGFHADDAGALDLASVSDAEMAALLQEHKVGTVAALAALL